MRAAWPLALAVALATASCGARELPGIETSPVVVGPASGALILAGGGPLGSEIMGRFVELAGGPDAPIVVIPTASEGEEFGEDWQGLRPLRQAGARNLRVLHTRDRAVADADSFVAGLGSARGVWIPGGRQWRLSDVYLDTRTHEAIRGLLARGGVVGGTSAGASIQPSYMVRGAPEGNHIVMAPGHERGLALLRDVAVDQHLLVRERQRDLLDVIAARPELLGIGLDEGTAIVVRGDTAEVVGRSMAAFYNARDADGYAFYFLAPGNRFDLRRRVTILGAPVPPDLVPSPGH
jgi:cyanophycinase